MRAVGSMLQNRVYRDPVACPAGVMGRTAPVPMRYGTLDVCCRTFAAQDTFRFRPHADTLRLILPLSGSNPLIGGAAGINHLEQGSALIVAQAAAIECRFEGAGALLLVDLPRLVLHAKTFAVRGEPRRLGRLNIMLDCDIRTPLGRALSHLPLPSVADALAPADDASEAVVEAIGEALCHYDADYGGFPIAASVQRALARLAEHGHEPVSLDEVVRAAAVAPMTLSRAVKDTTGISLTKLMQHGRLDWAHARLANVRELRSVSDLALVVGYRPAVFTRTYQRRFGQTPTQTRAQAFAMFR